MKTRIIQDEPEAEPPETRTEEPRVPQEREAWLRRTFVAAAVVGYVILGVVHPANIEVGDSTTLYLWIHVLQPFALL